jgi:hypothetical protein
MLDGFCQLSLNLRGGLFRASARANTSNMPKTFDRTTRRDVIIAFILIFGAAAVGFTSLFVNAVRLLSNLRGSCERFADPTLANSR